jgi:isoquinoline 1-oxidoreductase subunit beta
MTQRIKTNEDNIGAERSANLPNAKSVARRGFLKAGAAISGGVMFGLVIPGSKIEAQAAGTLYTPNAWVHIADNNEITLISNQSEMGQGVYTALPTLIAEELNVDPRRVKVAIAPPGQAYINTILGAQLTGGSASVRSGYERLRIAGAQVREMLITAAANTWNVDRAGLKAENGMVTGPGGKKATYGQLAAAASRVPVPEKVAIKDASQFRLVGKPMKRLDTPLKVNGSAEFGIDVKLPGMVYAAVKQCPVIGGKVKSLDSAAAKAMPGVIDVVNMGEGVAVVANSWWRANKATNALKIEWDEGPGAALSTASVAAAIEKAAVDGKVLEGGKPVGNFATGMAGATRIIRSDYWSQNLAHAPIEPMNFTASFKDGKMLLIGGTQFQQGAQGAVAAVLGIKPDDITVKTTFLGGGFGRRLELDFILQAAMISKAIGKPVKMVWTREEDMTHDFYRPMALNRMEAGLDAQGNPVAYSFRLVSQSVTQRAFGLPKDIPDPFMLEYAQAPYSIPNTKHDLVIHDTGMRVGYLRSVSHPFNVFANEGMIDEMAALAGKDPVAYRMGLLKDKPRFANVLKLAADKASWGSPLPTGRTRGVALMDGYDSYMAVVSEVSVNNGQVKVHKITAAVDIGQIVNPDIVNQQIESSVVFGLTMALMGNITLDKGRVQQGNYGDYPIMRFADMPEVDTVVVKSTEKPGGIGEPIAAIVGAATANAVSTATGKRQRRMPLTAENVMKA